MSAAPVPGTPAPPRRTGRRWLILAVVAVVGLVALIVNRAAGGDADAGPSAEQRGAQAAAEAYLDAIADGDVATADAMTDPERLVLPTIDDMVDITDALPDAETRVTEPWARLVGDDDAGTFTFQVSYRIGDLTGGDVLGLRLGDGDPDDVGSWVVTDPLLSRGTVYAAVDTVPVVRVGGVDVPINASSVRAVWGYPGSYVATAATDPGPYLEARALTFGIGAPDAPPWDDSLPMVDTTTTPALTDAVTAQLVGALQACVDGGALDTPACRDLPEPWSLDDDADALEVWSGAWDPFVAPTVAVSPEGYVRVSGGSLTYRVHSGVDRATGERVDGHVVSPYLPGSGWVRVDGDAFTLDWN